MKTEEPFERLLACRIAQVQAIQLSESLTIQLAGISDFYVRQGTVENFANEFLSKGIVDKAQFFCVEAFFDVLQQQ
jgi:hypothetical protein